MRLNNVRLDPSKCALGVNLGKFIGFMINERGIKVSGKDKRHYRDRVSHLPQKGEVQCPNGHLIALGKLLANSRKKLFLFF